jgi:D-amino peptidase
MKKWIGFLAVLLMMVFFWGCGNQQSDGLKVFISVDMEGVAGVVSSLECSSRGPDYEKVRRLMTLETNAAVEGALAAGASEVLVRDGHGAKTNILPHLLHPGAKLMRGVTDRPENMMLGLDESFDAVVFIGYHAKAGTEQGIISHTSSGNVIDLSVNGVSLPEAGYNALIAGLYDVPVVLLAGDNWICAQVQELFGEIATVETKVGFKSAALCKHSDQVCREIREEAEEALRNLARYTPYRMTPPYTMILKVKKERDPYPGAEKKAPGEFHYTSEDFLAVMDAFNHLK